MDEIFDYLLNQRHNKSSVVATLAPTDQLRVQDDRCKALTANFTASLAVVAVIIFLTLVVAIPPQMSVRWRAQQ